MRVNAMLAAIAIAAAVIAMPAAAAVRSPDDRAAAQYVRARAADAAGNLDVAAAGYAAALTAAPNDALLALRTYRQAMLAGDQPLARRAAAVLAANNALPADARLFRLSEAVLAKDWAAARQSADAIEKDEVFGFLVPILRGWIAYGAGDADPLAKVADVGKGGSLTIAYAGEQRALLLLAMGRKADGIAAVRALGATSTGRGPRLRLTAAATLAAQGDRPGALALIEGLPGPAAVARERLAAGGTLNGAVTDAPTGIAELLVRVGIDVSRERVTPLAVNMVRLATFLAPGNSESWLATAELLASSGHSDAALAALGRIPADDPLAEGVRVARMQLLVSNGERQQALAEVEKAAAQKDASMADFTRLGDLLGDLDRPKEAAAAYTKALAMIDADPDLAASRWTVLMLRGGMLDAAGDWNAALADLRAAAKLAPDQAVVLNYLGYAQLERRENLAEAEKLIERASLLKPDDAAITDSLGWTYYIRGDLPKAISTLERAVAGEPAEPTMNEHLGDAYWSAGRRYEARYAWRAALLHADDKIAPRIRTKIDAGLTTASAAP
jgi:tetratricopeptide (TPR) repeat protein